jgi:hypothetical protein
VRTAAGAAVAFVVLIAAASPAHSNERCIYLSSHYQTIEFHAEGRSMVFDGRDGSPLTCSIAMPDKTGWEAVDCGVWKGRLIAGPAHLGGEFPDLVVFQSDFFYYRCVADL